MALEADGLLDRRRLKRRLTIWRAIAIGALVLAASAAMRGTPAVGGGPHIARYRISGEIGDGNDQVEALERLGKDTSVKAVLLHLDTPGGAVGGGESIYAAVSALAAQKPVVAVMDGMAASAGYMIAVGAPHIVARGSTLTGSIGVLMQTAEFSGLMQKLGVGADQLVSGPLKGQPSPLAPLSPEGRSYLQALIGDMYDQFVQKVADGRHMDVAKVKLLADGRAYSGRQAQALGLVDELGGDAQAIAWLAKSGRLKTADLPVIDAHDPLDWQKALSKAASAVTVSALSGLRVGAMGVDGVYALWQPPRAQ
jgi:protease-4